MKIAVCSDLHLEFGKLTLKNTDNADVLILSGDICVAKDLLELGSPVNKSETIHDFFRNCSVEFKKVIYIVGNHEHYHGNFNDTIKYLQNKLGYLKNLHILDKEVVTIDGVTFIGGTLWTDMNGGDPMTLNAIGRMMNDFRCVKNSNKMVSYKTYLPDPKDNTRDLTVFKERAAIFSPQDAVEDHNKMVDYIYHVVRGKDNQKFVVVGHHAPSKLSTHPKYQHETLMNGGYSSDLSQFILDNPQIKLWTHGHTHETFDYMIGETRIVCNPRGYVGYENRADEFKLKTVEL
jgi:predicted phosphodiesterase